VGTSGVRFLLRHTMLALCLVVPGGAHALCYFPATCQPGVVERRADGVWLTGIIDDQLVDRADVLVKVGDRLNVDSSGGSPRAAIRLGEMLLDRNVTVVVQAHCMSVCARYVFLAAKTKVLKAQAYLWFDGSAAFDEYLVRNSDLAVRSDQMSAIETVAKLERSLYAKAGINSALLRCIDSVEDVRSVVLVPRAGALGDSRSGNFDLALSPGAYDVVAFSKATLEHFGVEGIAGYAFPYGQRYRAVLAEVEDRRVAWVDGGDGHWCEPSVDADSEPGWRNE